jgi:phosphoglycolate phosphatase
MADYRVLLWDFDGTLADTLGDLLRIYNGLAAQHGCLPITDPEIVRRASPLALLRRHGVSLVRLPFLLRAILAAQRERMAHIRMFPGLLELLPALRRRGYRLGIVSSNEEQNIRACLRANQVEDLFECVVGCSRLFSKGRTLRKVRRSQATAPEHVLYIGDEVRDIEAARQAGVAVTSVTWGFHAADVLARHQPDHLIHEPGQLLDLLGGHLPT